MRLVILETPYAGPTPADIDENVRFARTCLGDCLRRGESPLASHLLFTQPGVLRDEVPEERTLGIAAGHAWYRSANAAVAYLDRGVSRGMVAGLQAALQWGVEVELRRLDGITVDWTWVHAHKVPHHHDRCEQGTCGPSGLYLEPSR